MDIRPTELTDDQQAQFDQHIRGLFDRLLDEVEIILEEIESPELQDLTYKLAFKPNDVLPKRHSRPQVTIAHLTEQVYLAHGGDDAARRKLLRFAIVVQEYYDTLDDIVDGDVAAGYEPQAMVVTQLMMPLMVRMLGQMGEDAVDYWTCRAQEMVESLYLEKCREKSFDSYLSSLEQQSYFFGFATGLAAVVAGEDDETVERAESIGRTGYKYAQFVLDLYQEDEDDPDNWNALHFVDRDKVLDYLGLWRDELESLLDAYPEGQAFLIKAMFSVELDSLVD